MPDQVRHDGPISEWLINAIITLLPLDEPEIEGALCAHEFPDFI
jgi:hypothetical protein